jgi:hypothetical protein
MHKYNNYVYSFGVKEESCAVVANYSSNCQEMKGILMKKWAPNIDPSPAWCAFACIIFELGLGSVHSQLLSNIENACREFNRHSFLGCVCQSHFSSTARMTCQLGMRRRLHGKLMHSPINYRDSIFNENRRHDTLSKHQTGNITGRLWNGHVAGHCTNNGVYRGRQKVFHKPSRTDLLNWHNTNLLQAVVYKSRIDVTICYVVVFLDS